MRYGVTSDKERRATVLIPHVHVRAELKKLLDTGHIPVRCRGMKRRSVRYDTDIHVVSADEEVTDTRNSTYSVLPLPYLSKIGGSFLRPSNNNLRLE